MADLTITRGTTLPNSASKTDFHNLVDTATGTVTNIVNADINASAAIADTKLATITTSQKVNLSAVVATSQAQGDVIYASSSTALARLGAGTNGQALTTGGASANPSWAGMTTSGDIEYHNGTTRTRLAKGTALQYLKMNSGATAPEWASLTTEIIAGSYTGNGSDNRSITVGFTNTSTTPKMVWVHQATTGGAIMRTGDANGIAFSDGSSQTNTIKSFSANTFVIGTDGAVNTNSTTYRFLAFA